MRARILLGVLLAACTRRIPISAPAPRRPASLYCFTAEVHDHRGQRALGCFDTVALCQGALHSAQRLGSMVGVQKLTACERWSGR